MDAEGDQTSSDSDFAIDELLSSELPHEVKNPNHTHPILLSRFGDYDAKGQTSGDSDFDELLSFELPKEIKHPNHTHPLLLSRFGDYDAKGQTSGNSDFDELLSSKLPNEVKNPNHTHPILLSRFGDYERCLICEVRVEHKYYWCKTCDFNLCADCVRKPFVTDPKRSHEHPLSLVPSRSLLFTCLACGVNREAEDSYSFLCICIPCCFIIHRECVSLPRVIYINRHDHRISHVSSLAEKENWKCKVCRKTVDWRYGSYSCSTCPNYVVHSLCATSRSVWDGIELEGVPEEDPDEILPFKVVGEGVIKYFSHDHNLRLITVDKETNDGYIQCNACVGHIYSESCYICTHDDCSFVLHEACANLLQKKRHPSHPHRLTLMTKVKDFTSLTVFECKCCRQYSSGFAYVGRDFCIDVRCASIIDGCVHGSHPHPLYFNDVYNRLYFNEDYKCCSECKERNKFTMNCEECEGIALCFRCATLPYEVIKHKYDRHAISLCYGEENPVGVVYWCEICEKRLDPSKWFYTCGECCSTLHIHCVLGEDPYVKLGAYSDKSVGSFQVVLNNYTSFQPKCHSCPSRYEHDDDARNKPPFLCHGLNVFKSKNLFFCSSICLLLNSISNRI